MDVMTAVTESAKLLGYDKLKTKQLEAISAFVTSSNVFVSLLIGYGKSIIYAILPYTFNTLKCKLFKKLVTKLVS